LVRALSEGIGEAGFPAVPADAEVAPEDVVTTVAARIAAALTELPESFCLAGWSYGGVLAFEVARLLARNTGVRPPIVLLDAWDDGDLVPLDEPMVQQRFVHDVARLAGQDGPRVRAVLDDPGLSDIRKTLASLDVDLRLSDDELAGRYAIFRAAALALQTYQPSGPYDGPVTLLAVSGGGVVERWRAVCTGRFESDVLPGDHYTLFTEPALGRIVAEIERALTR
jgi:thioesterase domain-containing protein